MSENRQQVMKQTPEEQAKFEARWEKQPKPYFLADLLGEYEMEQAEQLSAVKAGKPRGVTSGMPSLDNALGGFLRKGLYVCHGAAGSGKSSIAAQWAGDCGVPALFVTTEMSPLELLRRHVARVTRYPHRDLLSGRIDSEREMELVRKAVEQAPKLMILDATRNPALIEDVRLSLALTRGRAGGYCMLVIDSLHSWVAPIAGLAGVDEYTSLNEGMAQLRGLAEDYEMPVILLAERNRYSSDRGGLAASRGSGRIEYGCDFLLDLGPDEDAIASGKYKLSEGTPMLLKILKNRQGKRANIPLMFFGSHLLFEERK